MYCKECGAFEPDNSRRCHICGTDFVYSVDKKTSKVEDQAPYFIKKPKKKMRYYKFLMWVQIPLTIIAIVLMSAMYITGIDILGHTFSTGKKNFDYTYAAIYLSTYLPFAFYIEYCLMHYRRNTGKIFAVFTISQLVIEAIIATALYSVYKIVPNIPKMMVVDVVRLLFWTVIVVLYINSRKEQLVEAK